VLVVLVLGAACVLAWRRTRNPIYLVFLLACACAVAEAFGRLALAIAERNLGSRSTELFIPADMLPLCWATWITSILSSLCIGVGSAWFLIGRRRSRDL
jgi:hypothetical protein